MPVLGVSERCPLPGSGTVGRSPHRRLFARLLVFKCMTGREVSSRFPLWDLSVLPKGPAGTFASWVS